MICSPEPVLLGTVALDPNRWGTVTGRREASIPLSPWLISIATAGFDGLEVWEPHLRAAEPEVDAVLTGPLPTVVLNGYAALEDAEHLQALTALIEESRAAAVKTNTGADASRLHQEAQTAAQWLDRLPSGVRLLLECHHGTAIADDHSAAARFLAEVGPADLVQAIVHTHEDSEHVRARFDAYGERITHAHVNHLDAGSAPPLVDVDDLADRVALLRSLGFRGSWTIEFVHGLLTARDRPEVLVEQAIADLAILRQVLAG